MSLVKDLRDLVDMFHNGDGPGYRNMAQKRLEKDTADLERQLAAMRSSFHVNMLSAFPAKSHEEIAAEIDRAIGPSAQPTAQQVEDSALLDWLEGHDARFYNMDRITSVIGKGFNGHPRLRDAIIALKAEKEKE